MNTPTSLEQFMLELVNRARMDPLAEAARYSLSLNSGLPAGTISSESKQVLAWNTSLGQSSDSHSTWMLDTDIFSHTGLGGSQPTARMVAAGYSLSGSWSTGENIAWNGDTGPLDSTEAILLAHQGLYESPGHRATTFDGDFRELGIGAQAGAFRFGGSNLNAMMVTQNFAFAGNRGFVTGVVYKDLDADDFYSPGEGSGATFVSLSGKATAMTTTYSSGGYGLSFNPSSKGASTIKFSGGGLTNPVTANFDLADVNIKIDLVDSTTIQGNTTIALGLGAKNLLLLGQDSINGTGNNTANLVTGNRGNNELNGLGGADTMTGGSGLDTYHVDSPLDRIIESPAGGLDQVKSSTSFTLPANVEKLFLTGTAPLAGRGHAGTNTISGNTGNNSLFGAGGPDILIGGAGTDNLTGANPVLGGKGEKDTLTGGLGADRFTLGSSSKVFYDDKIAGNRGDTDYALITDFSPNEGDRLVLNGEVADYFLRGSLAGLPVGKTLFHDTNQNGIWNGSDEVIAVLQARSTPLGESTTIGNAIFLS